MSGPSIQTKFTLGLLSVDPNDPANQIPWEEDTSEEVLAINQAARDAIKAKKRAKKVARQKSKESQSPSRRKKVTRKKSKDPAPAPAPSPDLEAKKKEEEDEAARKRAEEEARKAEEERARKAREEEEEAAAKKRAEEEEARKEEEERARKAAAEEEAARKRAEEEAARRAAEEAAQLAAEVEEPEPSMTEEEEVEEPEPSMAEEEEEPQLPKERPKLERRISFFPATGDNTGLNDAIKRYGNDVPFEWEKEEWTREHVNLKHTSTMNRTYRWELPEWAKNNNLRKTELGEKVKQGACLRRDPRFGGVHKRGAPRRSFSNVDRGPIEVTSKEIISALPDWAKGNVLKTTEMGAAARQGLNLAVPVQILKGLAEGSIADLEFEASFADLGVAMVAGEQKNIALEKPGWTVNPSLKPSSIGFAVRQGANLALPVVERDGESKEMSPNASFAALNASQRSIAKEKPAWAKFALKKTAKGEQMKETGTLARGPTIKVVD